MQRKKRVMIDFDGTIMMRGRANNRKPVPGALSALKRLSDAGYEIVVHSSRAGYSGGRALIRSWLDKHGVECSLITNHKLNASYYVDDKAVPFGGSWDEVITAVTGNQ